jgi:hypothetical protein
MSPELERLLNALWERDTAEPYERARWKATVERQVRRKKEEESSKCGVWIWKLGVTEDRSNGATEDLSCKTTSPICQLPSPPPEMRDQY